MDREDEIISPLSTAMEHIHFGRTDNTAKKTLESNLLSARDTSRFLETVQDAKCRWNGHTNLTRKGKEGRTFGMQVVGSMLHGSARAWRH